MPNVKVFDMAGQEVGTMDLSDVLFAQKLRALSSMRLSVPICSIRDRVHSPR